MGQLQATDNIRPQLGLGIAFGGLGQSPAVTVDQTSG
jgi:hypothetical protein